jgi:hypothetical protein
MSPTSPCSVMLAEVSLYFTMRIAAVAGAGSGVS